MATIIPASPGKVNAFAETSPPRYAAVEYPSRSSSLAIVVLIGERRWAADALDLLPLDR